MLYYLRKVGKQLTTKQSKHYIREKRDERKPQIMFIEINKINSHKECGKALIKTEDVVGIKENHVEPTRTYDAQGNVVSETPNPKDFTLLLANGQTYHIDETQYQALVKTLTSANA